MEKENPIDELERKQKEFIKSLDYGEVTLIQTFYREMTSMMGKEECLRQAKENFRNQMAKEILDKFDYAIDSYVNNHGEFVANWKLHVFTQSEITKTYSLLNLWSKIVQNLYERYKEVNEKVKK